MIVECHSKMITSRLLLIPLGLFFVTASSGVAHEKLTLPVVDGSPWLLVFSPDSTLLAVAETSKNIALWDVRTGKRQQLLRGHNNVVTQMAFRPDGKTLIAAHTKIMRDGNASVVKHWEVATGRQVKSFLLDGGGANRAMSADGRYLVTVAGFPNNTAKVWDLQTQQLQATLKTTSFNVTATALTADGNIAALGGAGGDVTLWNLKTGKTCGGFQLETPVTELTFSPNGKLLAVRGYRPPNLYHFWDVTARKKRTAPQRLSGLGGRFLSDSKVFAVSMVSWVELWSVEQRKGLGRLKASKKGQMGKVAFSPDGRWAAANSNNNVCLWQVPQKLWPARKKQGD